MGTYQMKDMSISLFPNDKGDNLKRPDMKGDALIDGTEYKVSAWWRDTKTGQKMLSCKVELPRDKQDTAPAPSKQGASLPPDMDDSVPFNMEA